MGTRKKKHKRGDDSLFVLVESIENRILDDSRIRLLGMRAEGHDLHTHRDAEVVLLIPIRFSLPFVANLIDMLEADDINVAPLMDKESRAGLLHQLRIS